MCLFYHLLSEFAPSLLVCVFVRFSIMVIKGFRLKLGSRKGSPSTLKRLSKDAKGKGLSHSQDMASKLWVSESFDRKRALAMDMALDDFDDSDLSWISNWRFAKSQEVVQAKFREIFNPRYEPWEEVHEDLY